MKVRREAIGDAQWRALEEGRVHLIQEDEAVFRLTGSGRIACVQGLVTSDVTAAGDDSHLFGALLTNKGMIQSTLRITRLTDQILLTVPRSAASLVGEVLAASLPPRLCQFEDVTAQTIRMASFGARAAEGTPSGEPVPPGKVRRENRGEQLIAVVASVARGIPGYELFIIPGAPGYVPDWEPGEAPPSQAPELLEVCRIQAGIPSLGAEIDEKTLPQEVRLEELGAISYTKGCYLGQETVARLHFRGHANRRLALLILDEEPDEPPLEVSLDGKVVGRLTSACWSADLESWVAQAVLRREVEDGAEVTAAGIGAVVRVDRWLREP
ncbi:MAG TPA: glycine cleavage T C-terminal barrel domain-containing protein [Gemmatimonadales bacterium]